MDLTRKDFAMFKKIVIVRNGQHLNGSLTKFGKHQCNELAKAIKIDISGVTVVISSIDTFVQESVQILASRIGIGATVIEPSLTPTRKKIVGDDIVKLIRSYQQDIDTLVIVSYDSYTALLPRYIFEMYGIKDEIGIINEGEAGMFDFINMYSTKIKPVIGKSAFLQTHE